MIYTMGQVAPLQRPKLDQIYPISSKIYSLVSKIKQAYGFYWSDCAKYADQQMDQRQRIFEVELRQAALLLSQTYPQGDIMPAESTWQWEQRSYEAWYNALRNNMGWRVVDFVMCPAGYKSDPLSRQCVEEREEITIQPVQIPAVKLPEVKPEIEIPEAKPAEAKAITNYLPLILIGVVVLLSMGGK